MRVPCCTNTITNMYHCNTKHTGKAQMPSQSWREDALFKNIFNTSFLVSIIPLNNGSDTSGNTSATDFQTLRLPPFCTGTWGLLLGQNICSSSCNNCSKAATREEERKPRRKIKQLTWYKSLQRNPKCCLECLLHWLPVCLVLVVLPPGTVWRERGWIGS